MADNKNPEQLQQELADAQQKLETANRALEIEKANHEKTKKSSLKQVSQLQDKLQKTIASSKGKSRPTKTIDGVDYVARFTSMKMDDGTVLTAEEIFADDSLCKKLIADGCGLFKNIKADEAKKNKAAERARLSRPRLVEKEDEE
jgi:hypothetical protein